MKAAVIILAALCAGCSSRTSSHSERHDPAVYRDTLNGCEYLARGNQYGGLTPRMGADGKQICNAKEK